MNRTGFGWRGDDISERWGKGSYARWEHINYGDDRHQRLQALARLSARLGAMRSSIYPYADFLKANRSSRSHFSTAGFFSMGG